METKAAQSMPDQVETQVVDIAALSPPAEPIEHVISPVHSAETKRTTYQSKQKQMDVGQEPEASGKTRETKTDEHETSKNKPKTVENASKTEFTESDEEARVT